MSDSAVDAHTCREAEIACTCIGAIYEPDESCNLHGLGEWPPRCVDCGRFLPYTPPEAAE